MEIMRVQSFKKRTIRISIVVPLFGGRFDFRVQNYCFRRFWRNIRMEIQDGLLHAPFGHTGFNSGCGRNLEADGRGFDGVEGGGARLALTGGVYLGVGVGEAHGVEAYGMPVARGVAVAQTPLTRQAHVAPGASSTQWIDAERTNVASGKSYCSQ